MLWYSMPTARRLRVSPVGDLTPQPFTVLGWEVSDIAATIKLLNTADIVFERFPGLAQDALDIWIAPGSSAKVAWFKDPDGNILSLAQLCS